MAVLIYKRIQINNRARVFASGNLGWSCHKNRFLPGRKGPPLCNYSDAKFLPLLRHKPWELA